MHKAISYTFTGIVGILTMSMTFLSLAIHVLTIVVACYMSGIVAGMFSLMFPFFAEAYWFLRIWIVGGTVMNLYCLFILAWLVILAFVIVGVVIIIKMEESN